MTTFKNWMAAMGFNGRQITQAGEAIGVGYRTVKERMIDEDRPTRTELLAMSAVRFGLEPWSLENDAEIVRKRNLLEAVEGAARAA